MFECPRFSIKVLKLTYFQIRSRVGWLVDATRGNKGGFNAVPINVNQSDKHKKRLSDVSLLFVYDFYIF